MKHHPIRIFILPALLILAVTLACLGSAPRQRSSAEEQVDPVDTGAAATVQVELGEFHVTIEPEALKAGDVTFIVRNEGHAEHNFVLSGPGVDEKTPMLASGETATLEVTLEPGEYEYICTVPGHDQLGMQGTFTVTP